jgi:GNAT superfamily N-acetyltransferase
MITKCNVDQLSSIHKIINEAATAYKGVIPSDRYHEPYMTIDDLKLEISNGVDFSGYFQNGELVGVMGIQNVLDVALIRHAYVKSSKQKTGIGENLLNSLLQKVTCPVLIGTWRDAFWAINFYKKNGFKVVTEKEKNLLLKKYWTIPERQIEESVVLADSKWCFTNSIT